MKNKGLRCRLALRINLIVLLLSMISVVKAYDFSAVCSTGQTLYYTITDATNRYVSIVAPGANPDINPWENYTKPTGNIVLPTSVTNNNISYTVKSIGYRAFYLCTGLTGSLNIPNTVTSLGHSAFENCSGITSITIPNAVTSIGTGVFNGTGWYYNQPSGSVLYISNCCVGFRSVPPTGTLPIKSGTRLICDYAFANCTDLTGNLTIPSSVTIIGDGAFSGCSGFNGTLTIPNSVISIGNSAFADCSGLTGNLIIPNSVTSIGSQLFYRCSGFSGSLSIPNSVISIGSSAFQLCSGLSGSLIISDNVVSIGDNAFDRCSGFDGSLTIGNSVATIGTTAFNRCTGITSITVNSEIPPTLGSYAFYMVSTTIPVEVPCGTLNAYQNTTGWNEFTNYQEIGCPSYEISATAEPSDGGTISGAGTYELGQTCTLTATNNLGYIFVNWTKNGAVVSANASYTFTVVESGDYVANFISTNYSSQYLAIESLVDNNTITLDIDGCITSTDLTSVSYSRNGTNWTTSYINGTDKTISVTLHQGAKVYFKGIGKQYGNDDDHCRFTSTGDFKVYGNIMSLLYGDNFVSQTEFPAGSSETFDGLFSLCTNLVSADNLVLPATTLASYCYSSMFSNCTALTTAPELPATSLRLGCYSNMFYGCTALTTAPELPATSLVSSCYHYMFCRCTSLNEVTCWATNITASNCTNNWLSDVAATGTFHKAANMTDWPTGASGIPTGWTVVDDCAVKAIIGYGTGTGRWYFIASPVLSNIAPTLVDGMIQETDYDLYRFNQSVELEWENYKGHTQGFVLENGQGYLYANAKKVNLIFKGSFNENETKDVGLVYDAGNPFAGWNLVGNPFPVQAYANRSYYVMNEDGTGIEPVAVSSEVAIEPCTGVMVKAEASETNPKVNFSKTAPDSQVNQGILQIAVAQANTRSNTVLDKAIVSFNEDDALGKFVFNEDNAKIWIPCGNEDFAIVCAEKTSETPLNFEAKEDGTYTISVEPENVEMDYLHLIDNLTGADVDLLQTPEYTFDARKSDYTSRFKLVFATNEENGPSTGSGTFAFYNGNEWVVSNTGEATLQIVDMMGRVLSSEPINGNATISLNQTPGVYMLRLVSGDSVQVQKVVVR